MILAAGYGARLWPLTADRTKPALPVLGKPLVGYVAEYLARHSIIDVAINLHHRADSVRAALGDGSRFGVHLHYVEEPQILGTSGALDNARKFLEDDTFVVVNGKIITDIDLTEALKTHRQGRALATLVLRRNVPRERFSVVEIRNGLVTEFGGMPSPAEAQELADDKLKFIEHPTPLMFTGIQIVEPRIFDYVPRGVFSHSTTDVYPQAIAKGERIAAHVAAGMWYELSTIERYLEVSLALLVRQSREVYTGMNCDVSEYARVSESVLWDEVVIEAGAQVRRAVLGDGVRVRKNEVIENLAVVPALLIEGLTPPSKAPRGDVRGDNFVVPLAQ